ncbi:MAG: copper amine oxidase N-terminal domain-containing protein [Clostridia bacterium]|nr:copper amine oxidase N-terminal domain-containing protein [Clostridia bacterium]
MKNFIVKKIGILIIATMLGILSVTVCAHPGRTDAKGGHEVKTDGWGYEVGTYHYHDKKYENIVPVDKNTGKPTEITVIVKGENILFDQKPVVIDGRTLVPVRFVVEKLGYNVEWDESTQTVYIKNSAMENMTVEGDDIKVLVNNELIHFDVSPVIINGRTLIPIRAVVEKMGCEVDWDGDLQVVYVE